MDFEKPGPWCGFSLDGSYRALSLCACTCVCVCVCVCVSFDQINVNGASFMGFCGTCFLQYSTLPERCKNGALAASIHFQCFWFLFIIIILDDESSHPE